VGRGLSKSNKEARVKKVKNVPWRLLAFEGLTRGSLAFTRVAACTLALSPVHETLSEGFGYLIASTAALVASGRSGLSGSGSRYGARNLRPRLGCFGVSASGARLTLSS
jgi:hypothetical protein